MAMLTSMSSVLRSLCLCMLLLGTSAWAQFRVEVKGVGATQIPVAIPVFRGEREGPQPVSAIVQADLSRSGLFRSMQADSPQLDESTPPDLGPFRSAAADALVVGSVRPVANGKFEVRFRLWDVVRARDLGGQSFTTAAADLRLAAHRVADYVYEKLTGERGVFSTRIAYVTKAMGKYTLWVADADGENARSALESTAPIISPTWSADGRRLAYVSFESRKPVIYVHDVAQGRRRLIANFRGSNSAPAWSPDGKTLAITLTQDGTSQLYTIGADGGAPRRLTESAGIDTEPVYSPDGRTIFFVSDRGGSPQIYKMAATGGEPQRVTFEGSYNISPSISPDGRWLAYIARVGGLFRLHAMDLHAGTVHPVTDSSADEQPSFAPNGRLIVYATRIGEKEALMATTIDGATKTRIAGQPGDIREPDWGPLVP